tara:strand:- start:1432 stop:1839 length:408 start_codon:yes stop_codon:yes gene_type:complete
VKEQWRNIQTFLPDLVLLDVMMPSINGFEACRQLNSEYSDDCAPIIFITVKNKSDDVVEGFSAGGIDYLPKPFQPGEVVVACALTCTVGSSLKGKSARRTIEQSRCRQELLSGHGSSRLEKPTCSYPWFVRIPSR